jgi:hypothetical protein
MKFSIRDLFLVTMIVALTAGCTIEEGGGKFNPNGQYSNPGPKEKRSLDEFSRSLESERATLPTSQAPAPNPPKHDP